MANVAVMMEQQVDAVSTMTLDNSDDQYFLDHFLRFNFPGFFQII